MQALDKESKKISNKAMGSVGSKIQFEMSKMSIFVGFEWEHKNIFYMLYIQEAWCTAVHVVADLYMQLNNNKKIMQIRKKVCDINVQFYPNNTW